jgi:hypothetical protein
MSIFLAAFVKMFVLFAYLLIVGYSEWIAEHLLPDCAMKRLLLRKF